MPPAHARAEDCADGIAALPGSARTVAAKVAHRRRARRSRVAAAFLIESGAQLYRHKSQWCAALSASTHADLFILGSRTAQVGALFPGALAATHAIYSGARA